jgi:hypothetical protein
MMHALDPALVICARRQAAAARVSSPAGVPSLAVSDPAASLPDKTLEKLLSGRANIAGALFLQTYNFPSRISS